VREEPRLHRTLFLHQNENLTIDERNILADAPKELGRAGCRV
jgi:hypothetical protein